MVILALFEVSAVMIFDGSPQSTTSIKTAVAVWYQKADLAVMRRRMFRGRQLFIFTQENPEPAVDSQLRLDQNTRLAFGRGSRVAKGIRL